MIVCRGGNENQRKGSKVKQIHACLKKLPACLTKNTLKQALEMSFCKIKQQLVGFEILRNHYARSPNNYSSYFRNQSIKYHEKN